MTPKTDRQPTASNGVTGINGPLERPPSSEDLNQVVAYKAGTVGKVLKAPCTLRSQPKNPNAIPKAKTGKVRSDAKRTPRESQNSGFSEGDTPIYNSSTHSTREKLASDQMDGVADIFLSGISCRGSVMDLRTEFERHELDGQNTLLPALNIRSKPQAAPTKKSGLLNNKLWDSPPRKIPRPANSGRVEVNPIASKVMVLAAMFDTAAESSPFLPSPSGGIQKKRRETARVISPYTSNPSPRASFQSATSASTPVSLMHSSRISIDMTNASNSIGRKSKIPGPQGSSRTASTEKAMRHMSPVSARRNESRFSVASTNTPSRIPTPSRLPIKKKPADIDTLDLTHLNGSEKTSIVQSPLKLTAQQEIRPVGYHSSCIPQTNTNDGYKSLTRLSQHSMVSELSDIIGHNGEFSPLNLSPSPSRGRSDSSLRHQIRSLRSELSSKNEDCARLRIELEQNKKTHQVNEILLRDDLDRARADSAKWRDRAERAERKVDGFERQTSQINNSFDRDDKLMGDNCYSYSQTEDVAGDYSFTSGSDHLECVTSPSPLLTARMNQSVRRMPPPAISRATSAGGANNGGGGDGFSERSSSTVVRNTAAGSGDTNARLWDAVDGFADFACPGFVDEKL